MALETSPLDQAALQRLLGALQRLRAAEPGLTLNGLEALLIVAAETMDRDVHHIPTPGKLAKRLEMSVPGASVLLRSLADDARGKKPPLNLLTAVNFTGRRVEGYFLSQKGRELIAAFWGDLMGYHTANFVTFSNEDLLRLISLRIGGEK